MRMFTKHVSYLCLILAICVLHSSCEIGRELSICEHNVRLTYRYNKENTVNGNVLNKYIRSVDEYIFDSNGLLVASNNLPGISCLGEFVSEVTLPPGRYTVVAWGNVALQSRVSGVPDNIQMNDNLLFLDAPFASSTENRSGMKLDQVNSERLFYGYRTFSVTQEGISKAYVDMYHSHCILDITVRWKSRPVLNTNMLSFHLKQIPSRYKFYPGFTCRSGVMSTFINEEEKYAVNDARIQQYIPFVCSEDETLANHRIDVRLSSASSTLTGRFITYRYRNDTHPMLSLYAGETQVMKEIDLWRFFRMMNVDLDRNLLQEFNIQIEIDGDKVTVGSVEVGDWEEGGPL